jgi:chemotaxis signal transduction protein
VAQIGGTVMAVLDLGTRLGIGPAAVPGRMVVVWGRGREPVGLLVDQVVGLVDTGGVLAAPIEEVEAALPRGWLAGVVEPAPGRRIALLDLERVLGGEAI